MGAAEMEQVGLVWFHQEPMKSEALKDFKYLEFTQKTEPKNNFESVAIYCQRFCSATPLLANSQSFLQLKHRKN